MLFGYCLVKDSIESLLNYRIRAYPFLSGKAIRGFLEEREPFVTINGRVPDTGTGLVYVGIYMLEWLAILTGCLYLYETRGRQGFCQGFIDCRCFHLSLF